MKGGEIEMMAHITGGDVAPMITIAIVFGLAVAFVALRKLS